MHHHPRPRDPHAAVPERDFVHGYNLVYELALDTTVDAQRRRLKMLQRLDEAFPFHPALPSRILLRYDALIEIWSHPLMEAWRSTPAAITSLGGIALAVAATQPLSEIGRFIPECFFAEMLRRMNEKGSA